MKSRKLRSLLVTIAAVVFLFAIQDFAQDEVKSNPLKQSDLIKALESKTVSSADLVERIKNRGVDFQITESVAKELKNAGANDEIITAVRENYTAPKKKGLFGKIGDNLNKTAKVVVKTAPVAAEQLPQVQAAKSVVKAAKTASSEVEKEEGNKTKKTEKDEDTPLENPTTESQRNSKPPKQNGGTASGLKIGEYACTGSGGRIMIGLSFKVLSGNRFTNLDDDQSGTFTITGDTVKFSGGHLDGITGRNLKDYWFVVGTQASCGPYD